MAIYADTRFSNRRRALASTIAAQRLDAILVTHLTHVLFLTGFTGDNAALLVHKDQSADIATDSRFTTQIAEEVCDLDAVIARQCGEELLSGLTGPKRIGYEAAYVSVAELEKLTAAAGEDVTLAPVTGLIEEIRLIKDPVSLDYLEQVAAISVQAWNELLEAGEVAVGMTEREVAAALEYRMRILGSDRVSFDTIVASGANSAKPHHTASDKVIEDGDIVTVDFGAYARGFNSDMTRTVIAGHTTKFSREIYDIVHRAQVSGIEAAVPGTSVREVDKVCRDIIADAGYGEYFIHSTGHGVGLDVHEGPYASTRGEGELHPGMTLTIEPGIYIPGKGGVRIEDTLIIQAGQPHIITNAPKELTVV
ncbi:MAG: aminopeptidase P family protein [Corynebacterium sp.]|nr:aminopeptidase P family protein [Corynebacterium sp.]